MSVASMGHQAQLGIKKETVYGTPVTVDVRLVFVSESLAKTGVIVERDGLRGTRSHVSTDTRTGPYSVGGQLVLEPTAIDLDNLFPWILGTDESANSFVLAETLQSRTVHIDRVANTFQYAGVVVNRATFSGTQGGLIGLSLDLIGQAEVLAVSFPALTASVTAPYIFHDMVLTLVGAARKVRAFELVIDNAVVADRFLNSTTIVNAPTADRVITLSVDCPYADGTGTTGNEDLYEQALAGTTGTLVLTGISPYVTTFTFGILQAPPISPTVPGRQEIMLPLQMVARKTGSTMELAVTHVSS